MSTPKPPRRVDAPTPKPQRTRHPEKANATSFKPKYEYRPEYIEELLAHFVWYTDDEIREKHYSAKNQRQDFANYSFPTFEGFAAKRRISTEVMFCTWRDKYPEWAEAIQVARGMQADLIQRATTLGVMPTGFAALLMRNLHGWETHNAPSKPENADPNAPEHGGTVPEATGFRIVLVTERDDAYYAQWVAARQKNILLKRDEEEGLEAFAFYDQVD